VGACASARHRRLARRFRCLPAARPAAAPDFRADRPNPPPPSRPHPPQLLLSDGSGFFAEVLRAQGNTPLTQTPWNPPPPGAAASPVCGAAGGGLACRRVTYLYAPPPGSGGYKSSCIQVGAAPLPCLAVGLFRKLHAWHGALSLDLALASGKGQPPLGALCGWPGGVAGAGGRNRQPVQSLQWLPPGVLPARC
jgi:hypothetical protein